MTNTVLQTVGLSESDIPVFWTRWPPQQMIRQFTIRQ